MSLKFDSLSLSLSLSLWENECLDVVGGVAGAGLRWLPQPALLICSISLSLAPVCAAPCKLTDCSPAHNMSRRASVFARLNPGKRRVRFPDEVVFEDHIKESDGDAIMNMLRRASVDIDLDRINMAGMTALHQVSLRPLTHLQAFLQPGPAVEGGGGGGPIKP